MATEVTIVDAIYLVEDGTHADVTRYVSKVFRKWITKAQFDRGIKARATQGSWAYHS
jgi:hypothetical protein